MKKSAAWTIDAASGPSIEVMTKTTCYLPSELQDITNSFALSMVSMMNFRSVYLPSYISDGEVATCCLTSLNAGTDLFPLVLMETLLTLLLIIKR